MSGWPKLDAALEDLTERGVSKYDRGPMAYRLAWRFGWRIPPPFFQTFGQILLFQGLGATLLFGLFIEVACLLRFPKASWKMFVFLLPVISVAVGMAIGFLGAVLFRWRARRLGLPLWRDYR